MKPENGGNRIACPPKPPGEGGSVPEKENPVLTEQNPPFGNLQRRFPQSSKIIKKGQKSSKKAKKRPKTLKNTKKCPKTEKKII
ncbi:MAG: hypothetical protein PHD86_06760 [Kiritimatiellae bacterium]|nr:hypothetical protein [Kiritimatiellia bacterium]